MLTGSLQNRQTGAGRIDGQSDLRRYQHYLRDGALAILVAIALTTASSCEGQSFWELGRPLYQFFSTRDYGGDNQNWSTIQDREGLLFFGNNSFVLDYDGQRWGHVAVPGGFAIRGLAVDASGAIWVGGAGNWDIWCPTEAATSSSRRRLMSTSHRR